jgi:hypothetical protein
LNEHTSIRKRLWTAAVAVIASLGAGAAFYQQALQPAPLEDIVPESAVGFITTDVRWAWDAAKDIREMPDGAKALADLQEELGFSVEADVVPWAGQVAGVLLSLDRNPTGAILVEVRNPLQYYKTMTRFRTHIEREATPFWKPADYNGVPLRYGYIGKGKTRVPVSTAWLKGWLVVGVGNGASKRIIDAWQNRKPSIADNGAWASCTQRMPEQRLLWAGFNSGALLPFYKQMGLSPKLVSAGRAISMGAVTDLEDGFRAVSASTATSSESRDIYARLVGEVTPVPATLVQRAPDGAFAVFAITNPGAYWDLYRPYFMAGIPPASRQDFEKGIKEMQPVVDAVRACKNGLAIAVTYREGTGFGATLIGDCGAGDAARAASEDLRAFLRKADAQVTTSEDGSTYAIEVGKDAGDKMFPFAPTWRVSDRYVTFATSAQWLDPGDSPSWVEMPAEAAGAHVTAAGTFGFVEPLLQVFASQQTSPDAGAEQQDDPVMEAMMQGWKSSEMGAARWSAWSRMREDGTTDGAWEIRDWPWRAALKNIADENRRKNAGQA